MRNANVMPLAMLMNFVIGLTNAICKHYILYAIDKLWNTNPNINFSMNASKMWCKSRFLVLIQVLLNEDANVIFMIQMSRVGMKMQSLFMMMLVCIFIPWCKCLGVQMPSNGYVMMQMSPCRYSMMLMTPCRYAVMQMSPCGYAMMQMSPCGYAMMWMLWRKHNLFKNSLCFQIEASSALETKIFSKLDLLFLKSHLLFYLRLLKKIGDHC